MAFLAFFLFLMRIAAAVFGWEGWWCEEDLTWEAVTQNGPCFGVALSGNFAAATAVTAQQRQARVHKDTKPRNPTPSRARTAVFLCVYINILVNIFVLLV